MSQPVALSGSDTIIIQNRSLLNLADGNCVELTFPNDIANAQTGKNQNSIYGFNAAGAQCEVKLRILRGSDDDKFLNNLLIQQNSNFAGTVLLIGEFTKKIGDGQGNIGNDTYVLSGGIFTKNVEAMTNVTGEVAQSVSLYTMRFTNSPRAIG